MSEKKCDANWRKTISFVWRERVFCNGPIEINLQRNCQMQWISHNHWTCSMPALCMHTSKCIILVLGTTDSHPPGYFRTPRFNLDYTRIFEATSQKSSNDEKWEHKIYSRSVSIEWIFIVLHWLRTNRISASFNLLLNIAEGILDVIAKKSIKIEILNFLFSLPNSISSVFL